MPITCVYVGGFSQKLEDLKVPPSNAYSSWRHSLQHYNPLPLICNIRSNGESLKDRWERLIKDLANEERESDSNQDVYILGYSLGTHLAVALAVQESIISRLKEIILIAPDPKFQPTERDRDGAFSEVSTYWNSGPPSACFLNCLKEIARRVKPVIVYSEDDKMVMYPGNVQLLLRECQSECHWHPVRLNESVQKERFSIHLNKQEGDIHSQLFANLQFFPCQVV